jgi:hypothetical protein
MRLHTAVCAICVINACVYRSSRCSTGPERLNSSLSTCPRMRKPSPALCTTERLGVVSPPMKSDIPTMPSLPTTAISAEAPSSIT